MRIFKSSEISTVADWGRLAPPKQAKHWKIGFSAMECARAWCPDLGQPCCPDKIRALLDSHPDTSDAQLQDVTPEHLQPFDGFRGEPRNADVAALATCRTGKLAISIEAKVNETFGETIHNQMEAGRRALKHNPRSKAIRRVVMLTTALLGIADPEAPHVGSLRYQLLTGVAGALAYAHKEGADRAVFIVHELSTCETRPENTQVNQGDLDAFVDVLTRGEHKALPDNLMIGPIYVPGTDLYGGKMPLYIGKAKNRLAPA